MQPQMDTPPTTTTKIYKPQIHKHPLFPSARFEFGICSGCGVMEDIYGGYFCNESGCPSRFFHKKCAEAPLEINHPSHPQHPLLLTSDESRKWRSPCDLCGKELPTPCYSCTKCEFNVDLACGMKPSPSAIEHPICHDHPLVFLKKPKEENPCEVCKKSIHGPSYSCLECNNVYFHVGCVHFSKEINHPCHTNHPLKLIAFEALITDDAEKSCLSCGGQQENVLYHCSICNFTMCLTCTRNPPPLVVEHIKTHEHPLTRFLKRISYTCDACGMGSNTGPYICLQCDFVIHGYCISLPRVININRHHHRVSFIYHLGAGFSKCGVCHKSLSQYHGAYSCSVCPNYAVHSVCALTNSVWDFVELEGMPDDTKDVAPFKIVSDDLIRHFSHEKHPLELYKKNILYDERILCEACIYPLGFESIYACKECCFFLHEKCANLPRKKRFVFDTALYTLELPSGDLVECCPLCVELSTGFKYTFKGRWDVNVHCGSLSEPFVHVGHLHPLYFEAKDGFHCDGCHEYKFEHGYALRCDGCNFDLCFYCASLPLQIWHRNDEHPLTLHCGEEARENNWCDNCEKEMYPCKWFYTCYDCEVSLHARCVLGDFSRIKLEGIINHNGRRFEVVHINQNTRPLCSQCHSRCTMGSVILKSCDDEDNGYFCSRSCFITFCINRDHLKFIGSN